MLSNNYEIDEATEQLFQGNKNKRINEGAQNFSLEVQRWFKLWKNNC